ncbi:hypothetical protein ACYOEI_14740 [Singulisphaera rosea]
MSLMETRIADPEAVKAEWLKSLDALVSLVKHWVEAVGWQTRLTTKLVTDPDLGRYEVPLMLMERGGVEVVLSPLARTEPGAVGVVDLNLMPTYDDIASLEYDGDSWSIRLASPLNSTSSRPASGLQRHPLDRNAMNRILDAVATHA